MHIFGGEVEGIFVSNMVESYTDSVCRSDFSIDNHYYMIAYLNTDKIEWEKPFLCELDKDAQICRLFEIDTKKYNLEEFWANEHPTTEFIKLISQVTGKPSLADRLAAAEQRAGIEQLKPKSKEYDRREETER